MTNELNTPDTHTPSTDDRLFQYPIGLYATRGAFLGVLIVMAVGVAVIAASGSETAMLGVAALAAIFGGVGMGGLLGASIGSEQASTQRQSRPLAHVIASPGALQSSQSSDLGALRTDSVEHRSAA